MVFQKLNNETVDMYLAYLKKAMQSEPDEMTTETYDEDGIRRRLNDPFYQHTSSILAINNGEVIGRIEYHFYGCIQDGFRMAYVDWVYVLPEHRRKGVARGLFRAFEAECAAAEIDQYYLIRSQDGAADRFYAGFPDAELSSEPLMRKHFPAK